MLVVVVVEEAAVEREGAERERLRQAKQAQSADSNTTFASQEAVGIANLK
jgi:hypothetical protein